MARLRNYKKTMARKMMTLSEIRDHISPFNCRAWQERSRAIEERILSKKNINIPKIKKIDKKNYWGIK